MIFLLAVFFGCSEQGFVPNVNNFDDASLASVSGRVCDPLTVTWLEGATVYTQAFNDDGVPYETVSTETSADGSWILEDLTPSSTAYQIYVQHGPEILETHTVTLDYGDKVVIDEPLCFDPIEVAVVTGDYDDLQNLLIDVGVYDYDLVEGTTSSAMLDFLADYNNMAQYDVILFNGGHVEEDVIFDSDGTDTSGVVAKNLDNIKTFVEQGGLIYATDWSYDLIEQIWPDHVDFLGDDTEHEVAQQGEVSVVSANVLDKDLKGLIGTPVVDVNFDLPVWPPMVSASKDTTVHLHADTIEYREGETTRELNDVPLLISFKARQGRVVFSSYRLAANEKGAMRSTFAYVMQMVP